MEDNKIVRVYTDGIYDLFHRGHIESLKICKNLFPNTHLIVGIIGDESAKNYKREPIYQEDDRYEIIRNIRFVDEIVPAAPLIITEEFINEHKIDYVVHGFSNPSDANKQDDFFKVPIEKNIFMEVPYYSKISTTDIIKKIMNMK
jgi:choline-phosphate cytidylyltransferase